MGKGYRLLLTALWAFTSYGGGGASARAAVKFTFKHAHGDVNS